MIVQADRGLRTDRTDKTLTRQCRQEELGSRLGPQINKLITLSHGTVRFGPYTALLVCLLACLSSGDGGYVPKSPCCLAYPRLPRYLRRCRGIVERSE